MVAGDSDLDLGRGHWRFEATSGYNVAERHAPAQGLGVVPRPNRSTRTPGHGPTADHVQVEVPDAVLRVLPDVQHQRYPLIADALRLGDLPGDDEKVGDVVSVRLRRPPPHRLCAGVERRGRGSGPGGSDP